MKERKEHLPEDEANKILFHAASIGDIELFEEAFRLGANMDESDDSGYFPIHIAADSNQMQMLEYLINQKNISVEQPAENEDGETTLCIAAKCGHMAVIKLLLSYGANVLSSDETGEYPIHWAIANRQTEAAKFFFKYFEETRTLRINVNKRNQTPYLCAAFWGNIELMECLKNYGVNTNEKTKFGQGALHHAIINDQLDVIDYLYKENVPMNEQESNHLGYTSFIRAAYSSELSTLQKLIECGVDSQKESRRGRYTALHAAVSNKCEVIEYLVKELKFDLNQTTKKGFAPLHLAIVRNQFDSFCTLLKLGADYQIKYNNQSLLHFAIQHQQLDMMTYLCDNVLGIDINVLTDEAKKDSTPLQLAITTKDVNIIAALVERGAVIDVSQKNHEWLEDHYRDYDEYLSSSILVYFSERDPDWRFVALKESMNDDESDNAMAIFHELYYSNLLDKITDNHFSIFRCIFSHASIIPNLYQAVRFYEKWSPADLKMLSDVQSLAKEQQNILRIIKNKRIASSYDTTEIPTVFYYEIMHIEHLATLLNPLKQLSKSVNSFSLLPPVLFDAIVEFMMDKPWGKIRPNVVFQSLAVSPDKNTIELKPPHFIDKRVMFFKKIASLTPDPLLRENHLKRKSWG